MTLPYKVMISSTARDLPTERREVETACMGLGLHPVMMEDLSARSATPLDVSLQMVDESAVYVGIFAFRYGYIPIDPVNNPLNLSITELEYRRAVEKGKPRLIFVTAGDQPLSDPENREKWQAFRNRVTTDLVVKFYSSPEELGKHVTQAIAHWLELRLTWQPEPSPSPDFLPESAALPPGSRIMNRNPHFVGREQVMRKLARLLLHTNGNTAVITPAAAATGSGGIGKTQLAVEFAHRFGRCFFGVHWVNLQEILDEKDELGRINAEIAECGRAMNLPNFPEKLPDQVALTLDTWRRSLPRLVILDNAEKPIVVRTAIQRLPPGICVLITSRWDREGNWRDIGVTPADLDVLSHNQSRELMRKIAIGLESVPNAELDRLAERLGDYPLALDLAAHYLRDTEMSVAAYLEALEKIGNPLEHRSLKTWATEHENANPTQHDTDVARTFALSWERITNLAARNLFVACGWLAPNQPISPDLLKRLMGNDVEALALARNQLISVSLLRSDPVQIHPLLAAFARSQDSVLDQFSLVVNALISVSTLANETGLPATFAPLRPHLEMVAPVAESMGNKYAAALWNNLGHYLNVIADYPGALERYKRALEIDGRIYGPDHPNVAIRLSNLGTLLQDLGNLSDAQKYLERALEIDERVYGSDHPNVAIRLNNLGRILQSQGDLPAAQTLLMRALSIRQAVFGEVHISVAETLNNLASVLLAEGDWATAIEYYEYALSIFEQLRGREHPDVAALLNNLGSILQDLGNLPAAYTYYMRALPIWEKAFGSDHVNEAYTLNNLANLAYELGDLSESRAYFTRALGIFEHILPPTHPYIQSIKAALEELSQ